jgi:isocitrate/isopropylmalate dehydrogenase
MLLRRSRRPEVRRASAPQRPEQAVILRIRKQLGLFANLRPAICYPELVGNASSPEAGTRCPASTS